MGKWSLAFFCAGLGTISAQRSSILPSPTYTAATTQFLFDRAQCPGNTFPCPTSLGVIFSDICCQSGQLCALDANSNAACCPSGYGIFSKYGSSLLSNEVVSCRAVCTGTAPTSVSGGNPTFIPSYVSNSYFSFPYAPTSFPNSAECESAARACSKNYDSCLTKLGGSGYAVTVDVPGGGGTTVNGDSRDLGTSATSICASLSNQACSKAQATNCDSFGQRSAASSSYSSGLFNFAATAGSLVYLIFA